MAISFVVYGRPQPKGSTRSFLTKKGKLATTSDNANLKPWQQQVALCAMEAARDFQCDDAAVSVQVLFHLRQPKSARKRFRPTVKPDVDKLIRAVLDGLTGIFYNDDAQVVDVKASKFYVPEGAPEQTRIDVWKL